MVRELEGVVELDVRGLSRAGCARVESGDVLCWDEDPSRPAQRVGELSGPATQLAVGGAHACALVGDTVWCWGANSSGQLGDGTRAPREVARAVVGLRDVVEVAAGREHTCARRSNGTVACWGSTFYGGVGNGRSGSELTPVRVAL